MQQLLLAKADMHDDTYRKKIEDNVAALTIKPIAIHASSFFKLDLSIVTGIIASITTYLIVVIQFKLSEEQVTDSLVAQQSAAPSALSSTLHHPEGIDSRAGAMQIVVPHQIDY
jgi:hypothetical protein